MSFPAHTLRVLPAPVADPPHPPAPQPAVNLIVAVVETMMGRRALHQLRPYLTQAAFTALVRHTDSGRFRRTEMGTCRTQMPTTAAVEASVELRCGARWITCVLRLDAAQFYWRCTEFTVLAPAALRAA